MDEELRRAISDISFNVSKEILAADIKSVPVIIEKAILNVVSDLLEDNKKCPEPKKSSFMEEWGKLDGEWGRTYEPNKFFEQVIELIDKHKADK